MDKETLSNYGWIVICVLVLSVMIALATPFGSFIADAVKSTTAGFFSVNQNALNSTGLINIGDQSFDDGVNGDAGQTPVTPETPVNPEEAFAFTIDGIIYQAEEGMTWAQWCESSYNPNKYTCLAGVRVITKDSNGSKITTIYSSTFSGGSVTLDDAEGSHKIIKDQAYQSAVATCPGIMVLRASDHDFTGTGEMGYTTYDDIANGLKNGQILAVLSGNKTFTAYNECYVAVNIYIDGNTTPSVTSDFNIIPATPTISLSGIPETTQWYLADNNHNKTGSVLGTGTSLSYPLSKDTDFVLVLNNQPQVNLITFTIDGVSYQAEEGMSWIKWVKSDYNTGGYVQSLFNITNAAGSKIVDPDDANILMNGNAKIVNGTAYTTVGYQG